MTELIGLRKQELECLRLESDCLQLAGQVIPVWRSHFVRMAGVWSEIAASKRERESPRSIDRD